MSAMTTTIASLLAPGHEPQGASALGACLIRPLGMVSGAAAAAAVEDGLAAWLAGGPAAFTTAELFEGPGAHDRELRSIRQLSLMRAPEVAARVRLLCDPRPAVAGLNWTRPRIMSTVHLASERGGRGERSTRAAVERGQMLAGQGADVLNVSAVGASFGDAEEVERVEAVVAELASQGFRVAISSPRPMVIRAAARAGARLAVESSPVIDDDTLYTLGDIGLPVILRRTGAVGLTPRSAEEAIGLAATIHAATETLVEVFEGAGLPRERLILDPGFGPGQPAGESLALLHAVALFHGLGCPLLVDCDAFIDAEPRNAAGTMLRASDVAAAALSQGVQLIATNEPAQSWPTVVACQALAAALFEESA